MGRVAVFLCVIAMLPLCYWSMSSMKQVVVVELEVLGSERLELPDQGAAHYPIVEVRGAAGRPSRQTVQDPDAARATPWEEGTTIVVRYPRDRWQDVRLASPDERP